MCAARADAGHAAGQPALRRSRLEVSGAQFAPRTAAGTALQGLQTSDLTDRSEFAAWSCPVVACDPSLAGASRASAGTSQRVATIAVEPLAVGHVQVRLDGLMLVGADGSTLTRGLSMVLRSRSRTARTCGPRRRSRDRPGPRGRTASTDIDGDGSTTIRDAAMLRQDWSNAAESGVACPAAPAGTDIDGDGCITIADLQTVAAHVTRHPQRRRACGANAVTLVHVNSTGDGRRQGRRHLPDHDRGRVHAARRASQEANRATCAGEIGFNIPGAAPARSRPAHRCRR